MKPARSPQPPPSPIEPPPADAPPSPEVAQLVALTFVLSARLSAAEHAIEELRAMLGLDAAPTLGPPSSWRTVKQAAHDLGCSESNIRRLLRAGQLSARKMAGRLLVDADTIEAVRR
jgi:excisionase family DNA binding protein